MMGDKKYLLLIISLVSYFAFSSNVNAALCDKEHINQLKELANQVEIDYEYIVDNDEDGDGEFTTNMYYVGVNLLSSELYITDGKKKYYYNDSEAGIIKLYYNSGTIEFDIYSNTCQDLILRTITINLPKFNIFSYRNECEQLKEYDLNVCDPWYQGSIDVESFNNVVSKYLNKSVVTKDSNFIDDLIAFFSNYWMHIFGIIILIVVIIIVYKIYRRRSVLE